MLTRRKLLAASAAAAALAAAGAGVLATRWWDRPPGLGYAALAPEEAAFLRALAGVAFPPGAELALDGATADLDLYVDELLAHSPATPRKLLKVLLHALDDLALASGGGFFTELPFEARSATFLGWFEHPRMELRSGVQSLVLLLGMGYTSHPAVAPRLSLLHGCGFGR